MIHYIMFVAFCIGKGQNIYVEGMMRKSAILYLIQNISGVLPNVSLHLFRYYFLVGYIGVVFGIYADGVAEKHA